MNHLIACRPRCYDLPLPEAMAELRKLGIAHIEANPPEDGDYAALARIAADKGVRISSFSTGVLLEDPEKVAALERVVEGAAGIGTRVVFIAASVKDATYERGIEVLRGLADTAHRAGVVLSVETHVPFAHNGDTARRTIEAVASAGIGWNFDTANIYYYNEKGMDAVAELRKGLRHVTSVHLKESAKGEPKSFDFPALGEGIVDFPAIFALLDGRGFTGPYTLELEGKLVADLPTEERSKRVGACVSHLRKIGAMD